MNPFLRIGTRNQTRRNSTNLSTGDRFNNDLGTYGFISFWRWLNLVGAVWIHSSFNLTSENSLFHNTKNKIVKLVKRNQLLLFRYSYCTITISVLCLFPGDALGWKFGFYRTSDFLAWRPGPTSDGKGADQERLITGGRATLLPHLGPLQTG